ncbi:hypothetical protein SDC9_123344 [bioreactor metagenome]|uniref:Uncharacterized protein n=1 Tax=bioreactor metagenome TaxID=1076179 RepID=A0A645CHC8_9ZZZZ
MPATPKKEISNLNLLIKSIENAPKNPSLYLLNVPPININFILQFVANNCIISIILVTTVTDKFFSNIIFASSIFIVDKPKKIVSSSFISDIAFSAIFFFSSRYTLFLESK